MLRVPTFQPPTNPKFSLPLETENSALKRITTAEGQAVPMEKGFEYQYFLKDHLGSTRVVLNQNKHIEQQNSYYPFGMLMAGIPATTNTTKYLYNGKELQDDFSLYWCDYGARFYDPQLGRWFVPDLLAEKACDWTPYRYAFNNPVSITDPNGMFESTHTDKDGNVVAVYDDGDLGVYEHNGNTEQAKAEVKKNYSENNTSAGGEKMGESLHSLSFADQSLYNKTGKIERANIKIDFGSTELTDKVQGIIGTDPSLIEYQSKAGLGGEWDLKSNTSNGSLLYGKYASPRDAGNFAAGAVAQMSSFTEIVQFGYGAYNLSGNSKVKTGAITVGVGILTVLNPVLGITTATLIGKYGEDKLSQRSIDIGKQYIKNKH